jgi:hypothetical protein
MARGRADHRPGDRSPLRFRGPGAHRGEGVGTGKIIAADPQIRRELALCHEWGKPLSQFLRWSEQDRAWALAYAAYRDSTCPGCGTRAEEWEPDAGGDRHAYAADVHVCPGCQVRGDLERELRDAEIETSGQYVALVPRREAERRAAERAERIARRAATAGG